MFTKGVDVGMKRRSSIFSPVSPASAEEKGLAGGLRVGTFGIGRINPDE